MKSPETSAQPVPLLDLRAQYAPLRDELLAALTRVCDSQQFIFGPDVDALERELAAVLGVRHTITVSSGTDAILAALMALGVGPGTEVITSTYSFFATAGCIVRLGATPVLVDIVPDTYNLNPDAVSDALSPRTRAIIPVHLFGLCADMDRILEIAESAQMPVVEDACQAIGARSKGRLAGAMGTMGCISFFPSKNLGAFGDGGVVITNDAALAHELRLLRNHGAEPKYIHKRVGGNFRLDALQAAILRVKLPHLTHWTNARRRNAARYDELFRSARLIDRVTLPVEPPDYYHVYNQYVVRVPNRDGVRQRLKASGVATEVYYPVPFHLQECFSALGHRRGDFPEAERAAASSLALPIYGDLTRAQQETVVSALADALV